MIKPDAEVIELVKHMRVNRQLDFISVSQQYLANAEEAMNKTLAAEILFQQIVYFNNVTGEYEQANRLAVLCLDYARLAENYTLEANTLRMMGVNYDCLGERRKARNAYDKGVELLEGRHHLSLEDKEILAGIYFNIVSLYKELDLNETRQKFIDKAFKLFSEIENTQGIARCYIAYANNVPDIKNSEIALEYYQLAADLFERINDQRGLGNAQIGIGYRLGLQGKFEPAMEMLKKGIEKLEQSSNSYWVMQGYFNLAIVLRLQKKYDEAIGHLAQIEETTIRYSPGMNRMFLYEEWAMALEEKGDYKEALEYRKKYQEERDKAHQFDKDTAEGLARR